MRDSKKILIAANALVVLFLLLSTYVFIYSMIFPVDVDYRVIKFKNSNTDISNNLEINRQEMKNSIDNTYFRIKKKTSKFENVNNKCNLLDHLLDLNSFSVSNIENKTKIKLKDINDSNEYEFDGMEGIIFHNKSDQQSEAIFDFTNMGRLYNMSVLTQIGFAFGLSGLYQNYDLLKLGVF